MFNLIGLTIPLNNHISHITFFVLLFFSGILFSQDYDDSQIQAKDVSIKLKVMLCNRNCPSYSISISGDGAVKYVGERSVSKMGSYTKQISQKDVAILMANIFNANFFTRIDESTDCFTQIKPSGHGTYEEMNICYTSSHGPFIDIEVKFGNQQRKVNLENLFSEDYWILQQNIIKTSGVSKWIKKK